MGTFESVGSLAYAVGFMGMGEAALGALQAQGQNVSVEHSGSVKTCRESFGAAECSAFATQLAKAIDGGLPPDSGPERSSFLQSAGTLGYPPCQLFC